MGAHRLRKTAVGDGDEIGTVGIAGRIDGVQGRRRRIEGVGHDIEGAGEDLLPDGTGLALIEDTGHLDRQGRAPLVRLRILLIGHVRSLLTRPYVVRPDCLPIGHRGQRRNHAATINRVAAGGGCPPSGRAPVAALPADRASRAGAHRGRARRHRRAGKVAG